MPGTLDPRARTRESAMTAAPTAPPRIAAKKRPGDLWFSGTAVFAGWMIVVTLAAVAIFLIVQSLPAFGANTSRCMRASATRESRINGLRPGTDGSR